MSTSWRTVPLGAILREDRERVNIAPNREYRVAGVLIAGRGLFWRDKMIGSATKYSSLNRLRAEQLVYRKLTAWEGPITIVPDEFDGAYVSSEFPTFTIDTSHLLPEFARLICELPSFHEEMRMRSTGTAERRNRLAPAELLEIEIDVPPIEEQRRIIEVLARATHAIDTNRAEEAASQTLLRSLWQRQCDRLLNQGIQPTTLGEVAEVRIGATPSRQRPEFYGGPIPWLKTGEIRFNDVGSTSETLSEIGFRRSSAKLIPPNTVVMAMKGQGATRGRVAVVTREMATNEACAAFIPNVPIDHRYLFHWFWSQYETTRTFGDGTSQPNLNTAMVEDLEVLIPPLEDQLATGRQFDRILAARRHAERVAETLVVMRRALLEELLSGERRVRI